MIIKNDNVLLCMHMLTEQVVDNLTHSIHTHNQYTHDLKMYYIYDEFIAIVELLF